MMKHRIITLLALLFSVVVGTAQNYVQNATYQVATTDGTNHTGTSNTLTDDDKIESITYFDGLGRPIQSIAKQAGGSKQDIVAHMEYDEFGRQVYNFLLYANAAQTTPSLAFRDPVQLKSDLLGYYTSKYPSDIDVNAPNPFSEIAYEASPLNRTLMQAAPGKDWAMGNGHEIKMEYLTNIADEVKQYSVTFTNGNTEMPVLSDEGIYAANELYKHITKDENWVSDSKDHTVEEFTDKQGRVVLKRSYESEEAHDTYYVYDRFGNLTYVIPPLVNTVDEVSTTELDELCYQYKYDYRNRLVEKKIPGKGWEYIVYDVLDRPVLTQDALLRDQNKWLFTRYDVFGRVAYTGLVTYSTSYVRPMVQSIFTYYEGSGSTYTLNTEKLTNPITVNGTTIYYTKNFGFSPLTETDMEILTINYYDDYTFDLNGGVSETAYGITPITTTKGLTTGSKVRVLNTDDWITNISYYDSKRRVIYTYMKNDYLEVTDKTKLQLDFIGKVLESTTTHEKSSYDTITTVDSFTYDHTGRLLTQTQQINSFSPEIIVSNTYDELGQLNSKKVGGKADVSNGLQNIDFSYNIRGWLTQINNPTALGESLFGFKINYNTTTLGQGVEPLYNGNISETLWSTKTDVSNTTNEIPEQVRGYAYGYDALNRILKGIFTNMADGSQNGRYSLDDVLYDKNGNIRRLLRSGQIGVGSYGHMDKLLYSYDSGNKLLSVFDSETSDGFTDGNTTNNPDYAYDDNGNMIQDTNKNIIYIHYNHLNLPKRIIFADYNDIQYTYDATGVKLEKRVNLSNTGSYTTQYSGGFIYKNGNLEYIAQPEGYIEPVIGVSSSGNNPTDIDYVYQYKDHLGNNRLSYKNNGLQEKDTFDTGISDWNGSNWLTNENGRLKVTIPSNLNWVNKQFNINPNVPLHISLDYDPGDMINPDGGWNGVIAIREYRDTDGDGDLEWEPWGTWNYITLPANAQHLELTASNLTATKVMIMVQRNTGSLQGATYCYLDNVEIYQEDLEIVEENNYYPFGLRHKGYNNVVNSAHYPYTYNGKEEQEELGLNWYDFGARNYDASLGRWFNSDPLVDFKPDQTPYRYGFNNPIGYTDPSGLYEIGTVSLTKDERQALRDEHGKGKAYREARKAKIEEKKDALRGAISDLKDFLDNNSEVSQIFQDFSGIEAGTDAWDNLWTENNSGPTINISGEIGGSKGFAEGTSSVTLNSGNSALENMGTILHEYVHMGDNRRTNGYDATKNGHPSYDAQTQRSAIEDVMQYSISTGQRTKEGWINAYGPNSVYNYNILDANGKAIKVELGYGFEKTAFGKTITAPTDYTTIFAKYVNKKK